MAWARFGKDTRSVSDVIGTVLLLGITTALFSVFSVAVLDQLQRNPPPSNVEFRVDSNAGRTTMVLVWGESLEVEDTRLLYELDGIRQVEMLSVVALPSTFVHRPGGLDTRWDLGESLRFACPLPDTNCVHPDGKVANITVSQTSSNAVVFSSEPGVSPGSLVNPVPDLVVAINWVKDPLVPINSNSAFCPAANDDLYVGGNVVLSATIANAGIVPTPTGSALTVSYYWETPPGMNPVLFHTDSPSQFLAAGESFATQNPNVAGAAGAHSIRVVVTASPSFTEATLSNNEATRNFEIVTGTCDPGQPYEDGDDDLLYNPYPHSEPPPNDLLVPTADVKDGVYTAGGTRNLVIPASVGPISNPGQSIDFWAPGDLIIGVTLEQTASPYEIRLTAGRHFNFTGAVDVRGRDYISITAGGTLNISDARFGSQSDDLISISTNGGPLIAIGTQFYIADILGSPPGDVVLTASHATLGYIDIRDAKFHVDAGSGTLGTIDVGAATNLYAQNAQIDAQVRLDLRATETIRIEGAILQSGLIVLHYDLSGPNRVYVDGATIDDTDACADTEPILLNDAEVLGTPASGRVEKDVNQC